LEAEIDFTGWNDNPANSEMIYAGGEIIVLHFTRGEDAVMPSADAPIVSV
jgi:hypothetical protein